MYKEYLIFLAEILNKTKTKGSISGDIKFAPYYDTFLENRKDLADIARQTGVLNYHLAFALGGSQGCKPMWGGVMDVNDPAVLNPIKAVQQMGGQMIVATGGVIKDFHCIPII